ncbi:PucR family transcriptional regulator [Allosalinactinospora lopnorensis]|uniref:PucR family transcriptional regulator n=1 Tax=Allosalinactinospora lopnorensis TaxID=1352348 RepID=UPI000A9493DB|nr:PucR family transcriptional regulator [Allosalinactinospora lopnorensis]
MRTDTGGRDGAQERQTIPLHAVTAGRPELALRTLVTVAGAGPRIRWTAISEVADPVPYVNGGELLLTAGVNIPTTGPDIDRYVASLVEAGVSALGFGVTPVYDTVPAELVERCRAHGLPLLEVPGTTPFVAVSQAVGEALEELHLEDLRRLGAAHRALTRAVTADDPAGRVVRALAEALECWTALVSGTETTRGAAVPPLNDEVLGLVGKLREPRGPRSAKARLGADELFLHTVGEPPEETGVLIIGRPSPIGVTDRAVLGTAVALLRLVAREEAGSDRALRQLAARLLLDSASGDGITPLLRELTAGDAAAYRVLHAERVDRRQGRPASDGALSSLLGTDLVDAPGPDGGDTVRAVLADPGDSAASLLAELRSRGWLAALSDPAGPDCLADASRRAASLLERARSAGAPQAWSDGSDPLEAALDPELARSAARTILGPLAADTESAASLRATLRVWLARHGNWDRTAADLDSHRNSVRYRIGRIERDLGVDLADPEHRMRLWFALTRLDRRPGDQAPGAGGRGAGQGC